MNQTLFDIGADMIALNNLLDELGGDVSGEGEAEEIDKWFAENAEALSEKGDGYGMLIKENAARAAVLKDEAKSLTEQAAAHEGRAGRLKDRLKYFMQEQGMKKLETKRCSFSVCANGGKTPLDIKVDGEDLPEEFRMVVYQPLTETIREALERGDVLPFAELKERGFHLRVK
jgi:hypothetical protein